MYVSSNYFLAEFFSRLLIYFADVCAAQVFSIQILAAPPGTVLLQCGAGVVIIV